MIGITTQQVPTTHKVDQQYNITLFTDPLCCWSWAFEPQLEMLFQYFGESAVWTYKMGGLIADWNNYNDHTNSVSRPAQMGPVWMHAGQMKPQPIQHQIWIKDPPASSYPPCIAVKCAQLQSQELGKQMFDILQNACMRQGLNIARKNVLDLVAETLAELNPEFNIEKYQNDFSSDTGLTLLKADISEVMRYGINRFPTLIIKRNDGKSWMFPGYRNHAEIINALEASAAK